MTDGRPGWAEDRLQKLEANDTPWPLRDVLIRLVAGADHLLVDHNCDQHGYETLMGARDSAKRILGESFGVSFGGDDAS